MDAVAAEMRKVAKASPHGPNVVIDGAVVPAFDELLEVIELHTDPDEELGGRRWAGGPRRTGAARPRCRRSPTSQ